MTLLPATTVITFHPRTKSPRALAAPTFSIVDRVSGKINPGRNACLTRPRVTAGCNCVMSSSLFDHAEVFAGRGVCRGNRARLQQSCHSKGRSVFQGIARSDHGRDQFLAGASLRLSNHRSIVAFNTLGDSSISIWPASMVASVRSEQSSRIGSANLPRAVSQTASLAP